MKKSTLKEVIKSEIKSLLLESQMTTDEAFRVLRQIQKHYLSSPQQDVMGQALDALQAGEVSKMMDRERSDFKDAGDRSGFDMRGIRESLNPEVTKALDSFITSMAKRYGYEEQDAVYAIKAALEQRKPDERPDFAGKYTPDVDSLSEVSIKEEEDPYGEGYLNPQLIRYKNKLSLMIGDLMDINTKIERVGPLDEDIADVIDILDRKVDQLNNSLTNQIREEEEMDDAEMDKAAAKSAKKGDSIATTSNKLQKLVKQMKDIAGSYKRAKKANATKDMEKYVEQLKAMTKEKKTLEKAL